jgi:hypothetical protein
LKGDTLALGYFHNTGFQEIALIQFDSLSDQPYNSSSFSNLRIIKTDAFTASTEVDVDDKYYAIEIST